jgi:hypothetical protein
MSKEFKTKSVYTVGGFTITVQILGDGDKLSHLEITDSKIYPDEDERSTEFWRRNGLLIPINSKKKLKELRKALK